MLFNYCTIVVLKTKMPRKKKGTSSVSCIDVSPLLTEAELPEDSLPTILDLVQYGRYLRSNSRLNARNYTKDNVASDVSKAVVNKWQTVASQFQYPITLTEAKVKEKVKTIIQKGFDHGNLQGRNEDIQNFLTNSQALFDILACKCHILTCNEAGCQGACRWGAHIHCECPKEKRIPSFLLKFVHSQRSCSFDVPIRDVQDASLAARDAAQVKQRVEEKRKGKKYLAELDAAELKQQAAEFLAASDDDNFPLHGNKEEVDEDFIYNYFGNSEFGPKKSQRNFQNIDLLAYVAMKGTLPLRPAAELITGTLVLAGIVNKEDASKTVDHNKLYRAMQRVSRQRIEDRNELAKGGQISDIYFDSKKDNTLVQKLVGGKLYNIKGKEEHYVVVSHSSQTPYLCHFTPDEIPMTPAPEGDSQQSAADDTISQHSADEQPKDQQSTKPGKGRKRKKVGASVKALKKKAKTSSKVKKSKKSKQSKKSELNARKMLDELSRIGVNLSDIQCAGCDSTVSNTGHLGGMMTWVEKILGRKVNWCVCNLHTNELPLRHLIEHLDGPTASGKKFTGTIGKVLDLATTFPINPEFSPIHSVEPVINLSPEVLNDLSTDQKYIYMIYRTIREGVVFGNVDQLTIGPVCLARWLTTAARLMRIYISHHNLDATASANLHTIVRFIVTCYVPTWFQIKSNDCWLEGPRHYLGLLKRLRYQDDGVIEIVEKTVRNGAWYAYSESNLQAQISSPDRDEREFAINMIKKFRVAQGNPDYGNDKPRARILPDVNLMATTLQDLIDWDQAEHEPPLTCSIPTAGLDYFLDTPMPVNTDWKSHTQAVERAIREVSVASMKTSTQVRRDGLILARMTARTVLPGNKSKKDLAKLADAAIGKKKT